MTRFIVSTLPFFIAALFIMVPSSVSGAENLAGENGAVLKSGTIPDSIPPLDRWVDDPFAVSMKNYISGKTPNAACDLLVEELIQAAGELTELVKTIQPNYSSYSERMFPFAKAQWKVRVLMETLQFLATQLPRDQQAAWKTAAQNRFAPALTAAGIALGSNAMMSAAQEIASLGLDFHSPYVDLEELFATTVEELAPPRPASGSPNSMGGVSMGPMSMSMPAPMPMGPMGSMMPGGSTSTASGPLLNACKAFLGGYKPGPVDDTVMEPLVTTLMIQGRTQLQGYVPPRGSGGGGMYGGSGPPGYGSSSMMPPMMPPPTMPPPMGMPSTTGAQPSPQRTGGLNLSGSTVPRTGPPPESLDDSVRKSIVFALKQMLRDEKTRIGGKIAAAYCAFATEDYVPEIALFLERSGSHLRERDLDILVSLPIEADYAKDPRVGFLMARTLFTINPGPASQNQVTDAFLQVSGAAPFLVHGLDQPRSRDMSLIILHKVGDGDSAVPVAKLLGDRSIGTEYRISLLEILGETGDQRVGPAIIRCLPDPALRESAKDALVRIGTPAEAAVATIFNAKKAELDLIAVEILSQIGSWKSLSKLGAQLALYGEAKTPAQAQRMEEEPKLILESAEQNELLQKTIEAGTRIIARMTESDPPNLGQMNAPRGTPGGGIAGPGMIGPGMPGSGMSGSGMMPMPSGPGMMGPGMPGSYPGSSSRVLDGKSPRTLATKGDMPPGSAPVNWMRGLAVAGSIKLEEATRILSRVSSYDTGRRAGEEMRSLSWVVDYLQIAGAQVKNQCLSLVDADAKRAMESSLGRIENRYNRHKQELNRIAKTNNPRQGFEYGFTPRTQNTPRTQTTPYGPPGGMR